MWHFDPMINCSLSTRGWPNWVRICCCEIQNTDRWVHCCRETTWNRQICDNPDKLFSFFYFSFSWCRMRTWIKKKKFIQILFKGKRERGKKKGNLLTSREECENMVVLRDCRLPIRTANCIHRKAIPFLLPNFSHTFRVTFVVLRLWGYDISVTVLNEPYAPVTLKKFFPVSLTWFLGGAGRGWREILTNFFINGTTTLAPTALATSNNLLLNSNGRQLHIFCCCLKASRHLAAPSIACIWHKRSPIDVDVLMADSYCRNAFWYGNT